MRVAYLLMTVSRALRATPDEGVRGYTFQKPRG